MIYLFGAVWLEDLYGHFTAPLLTNINQFASNIEYCFSFSYFLITRHCICLVFIYLFIGLFLLVSSKTFVCLVKDENTMVHSIISALCTSVAISFVFARWRIPSWSIDQKKWTFVIHWSQNQVQFFPLECLETEVCHHVLSRTWTGEQDEDD